MKEAHQGTRWHAAYFDLAFASKVGMDPGRWLGHSYGDSMVRARSYSVMQLKDHSFFPKEDHF